MANLDAYLDDVAAKSTMDAHVANTSNPHGVTKAQVGLGNVDNTSDANKPISTATQTALDGKVDENVAITGATKTKVTYDAKGLVTAGADATTADIADSTNKRYVTDAQQTVLGSTSGTNTGDETAQRIGDLINGATDKSTPVDADLVPLADSTASWITRKLSWANIKATLKTYFDTLYRSASDELTVRLASQQTTTSTTLVNCTGLSVSVEANTTYQIEGFIGFQSALATCGIFLSLNGPSSPTEIAYNINIPTASNAIGNRVMAAYDAGSAVADVPTINTTYFALLNGLLVNGPNAGTLIVRFASETGSTVRIQAGSSLRLRKVS